MLAKRGATELCEAAAVLRQCVDALLHLHSRGIVHRDVKPSNICFASPISDLLRSSLREEQVTGPPPPSLRVSQTTCQTARAGRGADQKRAVTGQPATRNERDRGQ